MAFPGRTLEIPLGEGVPCCELLQGCWQQQRRGEQVSPIGEQRVRKEGRKAGGQGDAASVSVELEGTRYASVGTDTS